MGCRDRKKYRRRGADPPRNESGMGIADSVPEYDERRRSVISGNGACIVGKTFYSCQFSGFERETSHIRLLCPSAATTLAEPDD